MTAQPHAPVALTPTTSKTKLPVPQDESVIALFDSHQKAEAAVTALQRAGIDMKCLSIVGKDFQTHEQALGFYTSEDRLKFWGGRGALWGALWGMLFGGAFFLLPVIGPIVVLGPLVGWIVGALEGAAVGATAGVLGAALTNIGLPKASVIRYETEVKAGKFLVLAMGSEALIEHARSVLGTTGAVLLESHPTTVQSRQDYITRESVLKLLSDDEVAKVSNAESARTLNDGEEYLDLEQLLLGVQQAHGVPTDMGRVLPRKALHPGTWDSILAHLASPVHATAGLKPTV
jgi:uncharacterized membrane protein